MKTLLLVFVLFTLQTTQVSGREKPVKIGVIGLTHTHVHGIFISEERGDIEIVGIVEPDKTLAKRYADQYGFSMDKVYNTIIPRNVKLGEAPSFGKPSILYAPESTGAKSYMELAREVITHG